MFFFGFLKNDFFEWTQIIIYMFMKTLLSFYVFKVVDSCVARGVDAEIACVG